MRVCQCVYRRHPDDRCTRTMTQEDGLCDGCRQFHPQTGWALPEVVNLSEVYADQLELWSARAARRIFTEDTAP